jgi:hypothetical protein
MKIDILENLRHLAAAPGVSFQEVNSYLLLLGSCLLSCCISCTAATTAGSAPGVWHSASMLACPISICMSMSVFQEGA